MLRMTGIGASSPLPRVPAMVPSPPVCPPSPSRDANPVFAERTGRPIDTAPEKRNTSIGLPSESADALSSIPASDCDALLRPGRLCRIELPVALFDTTGALVPGNRGADMVWASALACSGDFLLRLAGCQGENLIVEARRGAAAAS